MRGLFHERQPWPARHSRRARPGQDQQVRQAGSARVDQPGSASQGPAGLTERGEQCRVDRTGCSLAPCSTAFRRLHCASTRHDVCVCHGVKCTHERGVAGRGAEVTCGGRKEVRLDQHRRVCRRASGITGPRPGCAHWPHTYTTRRREWISTCKWACWSSSNRSLYLIWATPFGRPYEAHSARSTLLDPDWLTLAGRPWLVDPG